MKKWKRNISIISYETLWRAAITSLEMAKVDDEETRSDHLSISSILTGFFAFEGFLNFVGEEIAPDIWKDERTFFSKSDFRGVMGKVEYLYSLFSDTELDKSCDPYQTVKKIKTIRDYLVHNRVKSYEKISTDKFPAYEPHWEDFDTPKRVEPALDKIKKLAEMIRLEALKILEDEYEASHLHHEVFTGPLGYASGKTID